MSCDEIQALIIDEYAAGSPLPSEAAEHLAQCERCTAERATLAALGAELDRALHVPRMDDAATKSVDEWLTRARAELDHQHGRRRMKHGAMIAAGVLFAAMAGGLAGHRIGAGGAPAEAVVAVSPAPSSAGQQYILLLHESPGEMTYDRANLPAIIQEYSDWAGQLAARGHLISAEKLHDDGGRWVAEPPAGRSADMITGFFIITAASYDEALRIARASPHLKYGGRIEVRAIERTS